VKYRSINEVKAMLDNRFLSRSLGVLNPPPPISVGLDVSTEEAIKLLQSQRSGCVLVTTAEGKLTGIVTERDVVLKIALQKKDLSSLPVSEVMTPDPQTASMTTTIAYAFNMMSHGGFRNIPIVDDEHFPVGLISVKHLVDFLAQSIGRLSET
jgi:CBS domain-containing protein